MPNRYNASHHDTVVQAMATIFWGSAWADHVEDHGCCNLSGCKIEDVMPPIPAEAYAVAERVLGAIEISNPQWGCNWPSMFCAALRADNEAAGAVDGFDVDYTGRLAERFGQCLAYMSQGAGVFWFDDHAQFELKVPLYGETLCCDLRVLADSQCEEAEEEEIDGNVY